MMKTEQRFGMINIIDPSSTEFNRGSFCYSPYLLYNGLSELRVADKINLLETFVPENLDLIPKADLNIITLWSYPQIETALLLNHFIPFETGLKNVYYAGYSPLIAHLGLPHIKDVLGYDPIADYAFLQIAMKTYPKYYSHFQRLLLSDCDMHLQSLEKGHLVHPLFTSYGCPMGCEFCPSTKNCGNIRIFLPLYEVIHMLYECEEKGIFNIHFTDEDFFFSTKRAFAILDYLKNKGFHLIALGSSSNVLRFIKQYGADIFKESGLEVIEIGFESGKDAVSYAMGAGKSLDSCYELAEIQEKIYARIFWLVLTFFPGETITSLNETGLFLRKYGLTQNEVVGRLRTNGTKGGLGQFFQPYHGLGMYEKLNGNGLFLTERPIRLVPSYIPNSFLNSLIKEVVIERFVEVKPWLELYNIEMNESELPSLLGKFVFEFIKKKPTVEAMHNAIKFAVLARMGVIK